MAHYNFKLPDIGEGTAEAEIVKWYVNPGDQIAEDQPLLDVMTEKATVELTSPVAGKVVEVRGEIGKKAAVGSVVVVFEVAEAKGAETASSVAAAPAAQAVPAPGKPAVRGGPLPPASPSVRRRASEMGIDLTTIKGSGPGGRILDSDLEQRPAAPKEAPRKEDAADKRVPVIGLRRQISQRMTLAKQKIPHFHYTDEIDVTDLWKLRDELNAKRSPDQPKLSVLPFLMQAIVVAAKEFPHINATYDDAAEVINQSAAVHIGVATQTPQGLYVPVVRNAERRSLWDNAREISALAERARTNKSKREELSGSTITITSLGDKGGLVVAPIINYPEVAIIAPNKAVERPIVRNGGIAIRRMMNLTGAFDHRVVDGYDAALFMQRIRALLENPAEHFSGDGVPA